MNVNADSISGTINPVEKILILIGAENSASNLFIKARQYSHGINTEWFVFCLDPGARATHDCRAQFNDNLTIALNSGAKVIHLIDDDKIKSVVDFVEKNKIDRIVIGNLRLGKSLTVNSSGYFIDQLRKLLDDVEIDELRLKDGDFSFWGRKLGITTRPVEYIYATLAVAFVSYICFLVKDAIGYQTVGLIFLILTASLSLKLGRGAVILTALLDFGIWNFFFIPPIMTFHIESFHDSVVLFANLVIAITGGSLITQLRRKQAALEQSKERTTLLYSLLESLNHADSINEVVNKVRAELKRHFEADAIIYLVDTSENSLGKSAFGNQELYSIEEFEHAIQTFEHKDHGQIIKLNEKNIIQYFPLSGQRETLGVIGIATDDGYPVEDDKLIFLKSFITQVVSALEREISIDRSRKNQVNEESQLFFQTVLKSISREVRTSVSMIQSATSNFMDERIASDPESRERICKELDFTASRLNMMIENTIDMSKTESGNI
jgi:two-component system sensor histidine kinase KdpD